MPEYSTQPPKVIAALCCDFHTTAIGTRSRLRDTIANKPILTHVIQKLLAVGGLSEIVLSFPKDQLDLAQQFQLHDRIHLQELTPRSTAVSARIRTSRAWNLLSWRGGADQSTFFDEEYHPISIAHAVKQHNADHILHIHSHSLFLDVDLTAALIQHHLHKNHEMRITYTPSAPGLSGILLRADIALEMAEKSVLPWQLLAYDPANPTFDTLIREACMQVDPALSKIPNRFCADTDRSFQLAQSWHGRPAHDGQNGHSSAELCVSAARAIAPGIKNFSQVSNAPRELEIELTTARLTTPPGSVPQSLRDSRPSLPASHWQNWFAQQNFPDDLLLTFAGDGDPLLYPHLLDVLRAARNTRPLSICLQTDLASPNIDNLLTLISENLIDILSIPFYGHTQPTYAKVANADLFPTVMANLQKLAPIINKNGSMPLLVPRLLKVRDTIPELEPFFDTWIQQSGWAVIDYPTDRAGNVSAASVIDMAPPKRRPCRRLWDRLLLRSNGTAIPCDQDIQDQLPLGTTTTHSLPQMLDQLPLHKPPPTTRRRTKLEPTHPPYQLQRMAPPMNTLSPQSSVLSTRKSPHPRRHHGPRRQCRPPQQIPPPPPQKTRPHLHPQSRARIQTHHPHHRQQRLPRNPPTR